ncbi:hypothetical protein RB595_005357 [Gaeumannomyces hyphopodioides]
MSASPAPEAPAGQPQEYYTRGLRARFLIDGQKLKPNAAQGNYADFSYKVDEEAFRRRTAASLKRDDLPKTVPEGLPAQLKGPLVWTKEDLTDESQFVYSLDDDEKAEILRALEHFKKQAEQQGLESHQVSRDTFPLPTLKERLRSVCDDVYEGRGFAIVRGLDPDSFSVADFTIIYLGISSYIGGRLGRQNQEGSMLMHVILNGDERDAQFSADQPFHTDTVTDCLCLVTMNVAAEGGWGVLASAWTVYNELAATRPDLIHVLTRPDWPFDTFGRTPPYYRRAIMYHRDGRLVTSFSRRLLCGLPPFDTRTPGIPGLTEAQAEALDALHLAARRCEVRPSMARGDLRFVNNMALLHRREAFANGPSAARHLVRLWINNPDRCWALPAELDLAWARIFDDDEERERRWDVVPPKVNGRTLHVAGSCD